MMGADGRLGDRVPFATRWKRRPAATQQLRIADLADHALLPELDGAPKRGIPPVAAIAVNALRINDANAPEQPPSPPRGEGRGEGLELRPSATTQYPQSRIDGQADQLPFMMSRPGPLHQPGRAPVAPTKTSAPRPSPADAALRLLQ